MDRDTEIRKLALTLYAPGRTFRHLQPLGAADVQGLRVRLQNQRLLDPRMHKLAVLASLSGLLPGRLLAWLCETYLGAFFTAYLAHFVPPHRMGKMARHISASFLADCAVYLVPERIQAALALVPVHLMAEAARILAARGEFAVLGSLMDITPDERVRILMEAVPSPTDRLSISRFVSQKARMVGLMDQLSDTELKELIAVAFTGDDYLSEMGALLGHMNEAQIKRTAKLLAGLLDSHVQGLVRRLLSSPLQLDRFAGLLQQLPERSLKTLVGTVEGLDDTTYQALRIALQGMDRAAEVLPKVISTLHADAKSRIGGLLKGLGAVAASAKSQAEASPIPTAGPQTQPTAYELHLAHQAAQQAHQRALEEATMQSELPADPSGASPAIETVAPAPGLSPDDSSAWIEPEHREPGVDSESPPKV